MSRLSAALAALPARLQRNRLAAGLALLAVLLLLGWLFNGPIQRWLALPLLLLLWNAYGAYRLAPGILLWGLLLLAVYLLALAALLRPLRNQRRSALDEEWADVRRVAAFTRWLERLDRPYYRHRLNQMVSEIGAQALANEAGLPVQTLRDRLRNGEVELSPTVARYLRAGLSPWGEAEAASSAPARWLRQMANRLQAPEEPGAVPSLQFDPDFEPTLFYLEQHLEVKRGAEHS